MGRIKEKCIPKINGRYSFSTRNLKTSKIDLCRSLQVCKFHLVQNSSMFRKSCSGGEVGAAGEDREQQHQPLRLQQPDLSYP